MALVQIDPRPVLGPWLAGYTLDRHTVTSTFVGYDGDRKIFDTTYTALGELLFQFKYRGGPHAAIVDTAVQFVTSRWLGEIDFVTYPPFSIRRAIQPTRIIAAEIASRLGVPLLDSAVTKSTPTPPIKNVSQEKRASMLRMAIQSGSDSVQGKRLLVVDDLWQTGSTMIRVAEVLGQAGATDVKVLVMTRTR